MLSARIIGVVLMLLLCWGCRPVGVSDVAGKYVRKSGDLEDKLELNTNGTFKQTVSSTNGVKWIKTGAWLLKKQIVQLDQSYSTFDFERKSSVVPPAEVFMQTLWIERGGLVKNELEPKWSREVE